MTKTIITSLFFIGSFLVGCMNDLLDTEPFDSIGSEAMWKTESLADLGVIGTADAQVDGVHIMFGYRLKDDGKKGRVKHF